MNAAHGRVSAGHRNRSAPIMTRPHCTMPALLQFRVEPLRSWAHLLANLLDENQRGVRLLPSSRDSKPLQDICLAAFPVSGT